MGVVTLRIFFLSGKTSLSVIMNPVIELWNITTCSDAGTFSQTDISIPTHSCITVVLYGCDRRASQYTIQARSGIRQLCVLRLGIR